MTAKNRLLEFLQHLKIGQNAFEKKVGISNGYIAHSKGSFGAAIIAKIADAYPELNTEWLLTGKGSMQNPPKNPFSQMPETEIGESVSKVLMEMYKKGEIYPASIYEKAVSERDKRIEELQRRIWELEKMIESK